MSVMCPAAQEGFRLPDQSQVVVAVARVMPGGVTLLGTGFGVGPSHLATAAHVVGADDTNLAVVMPKLKSMSDYQDTSDLRVNLTSARIVGIDTPRDICVLQIDGDLTFSHRLGSADEAPPGMPVYTLSFPHADSGRLVLTHHGTQVGARVLIETAAVSSKHLVLNTQARPGQSGGPVFSADGSTVVGMLLGSYAPTATGAILLGNIDPATLHQTTHAISAEYIRSMAP